MVTNRSSEAGFVAVGDQTAWPAAVLWDMDGTLVDTEPYWVAAEYRLAERYGGTWDDRHALNLVGNDLLDSGVYIREHMGIDLSAEQIVEALLDDVVAQVEGAVPFRPGALELLAELRAAGVPLALVTMSYARFVDPVLAALPPGVFDEVVTGDAVYRGKPHPEPYLTAARLLGVTPERCLAIEDSEPGTTSAVAAGCTALVVPLHVPVAAGGAAGAPRHAPGCRPRPLAEPRARRWLASPHGAADRGLRTDRRPRHRRPRGPGRVRGLALPARASTPRPASRRCSATRTTVAGCWRRPTSTRPPGPTSATRPCSRPPSPPPPGPSRSST